MSKYHFVVYLHVYFIKYAKTQQNESANFTELMEKIMKWSVKRSFATNTLANYPILKKDYQKVVIGANTLCASLALYWSSRINKNRLLSELVFSKKYSSNLEINLKLYC